MAAQLINGNGFEGCTAQVDADFYEGIFGTETGILTVGQKMRAEMVNNRPRVYDGVILTKEEYIRCSNHHLECQHNRHHRTIHIQCCT